MNWVTEHLSQFSAEWIIFMIDLMEWEYLQGNHES